MRAVALDVHRDFCEVAIGDEQGVRAAGRIKTSSEELELFAQSLDRHDHVALEVTGNAWEIARILEPHVARVIVVSPSDTEMRQAKAKTDRLDAPRSASCSGPGDSTRSGCPTSGCAPGERSSCGPGRAKNEIHAALVRCLKRKPPVSDLFGVKGRAWLSEQELPPVERETVEPGLRQLAFLDSEVAAVEALIAAEALSWPEVKRLMTVPGVNVIIAATFMAAVDFHSWSEAEVTEGPASR